MPPSLSIAVSAACARADRFELDRGCWRVADDVGGASAEGSNAPIGARGPLLRDAVAAANGPSCRMSAARDVQIRISLIQTESKRERNAPPPP